MARKPDNDDYDKLLLAELRRIGDAILKLSATTNPPSDGNSNTLVVALLQALTKQGVEIMAGVQQLDEKVESITKLVGKVGVDVGTTKTEIQQLKDLIAQGGTITEAQLDAPLAKLTAIESALTDLDAQVNDPDLVVTT